jgi:FlaA1/EpsC-like NDP-sugar epimerase
MQAMRSNLYTEAVLPHSAPAATDIDWYSFLERPRLPSPADDLLLQLRDASILVTGAGGSIGSALSTRLSKLCPRRLVLLDASEQALYRLRLAPPAAGQTANPQCILGNIADAAHLNEIFAAHRPHFVFHAAAHKHVALLEENPIEAVANNALGTLTLTECARKFGVKRIVLLSTDKAVEPISILGASKRIAELITLANDGVVLRLANVLGTEGSVVETFLRQIAVSGPLAITDPRAERYFLTLEEAVDLLLTSAITPRAGNLLAPHLERQHSIISLAEFLIAKYPHKARPKIAISGLRPGDKTAEALWSTDEQVAPDKGDGYFEVACQAIDHPLLQSDLISLQESVRDRDLFGTMQAVLSLVPSYKPGATIAALLQQSHEAQLGAVRR